MPEMDPRRRNKVIAVVVAFIALVVAALVLYPHHVVVTCEGEGTVAPAEGDIRFYQTLEVEVSPAEGWHVAEIVVDGVDARMEDGLLKVDVSILRFGESRVHVVFAQGAGPEIHELTVTSTSGGTIEPSGNVTVEHGGSVTFTMTPDLGCTLSALQVDGVTVASGVGSYMLSDIVSDHDVHAVFSEVPVTHTVTVTSTSGGTIEPSGNVTVEHGGSVTFTIAPDPGHVLSALRVDGVTVASGVGSYTLSDIVSDRDVHAVFDEHVPSGETHTVTVTSTAGGSISPSGTVEVEDGGSIGFTITPDTGYRLSALKVDGVTVASGVGEFTLSGIVSDRTVHAVFVKRTPVIDTHTVTITYTQGGTVDPSGKVTVRDGGSLGLTIVPDPGFRLSSLQVDGEEVASGVGEYTIGNVRSDISVHAVFEAVPGPVVTLQRIDVTTPPVRTVYSAGSSFDPAGMAVTAYYSDGSSRVLSAGEYSYSPSGVLSEKDSVITVSYGGKTDTVAITVVSPSGFTVTVTSLSGTCVQNGAVVAFSESMDVRLSDFKFRTSGIAPGVEQTAVMEVSNLTQVGLRAAVYIDHMILVNGTALAEQMTLTASVDGKVETRTISQISGGVFLDLGVVPAGGSIEVEVTLAFPDSPDNNEAMGQAISFKLGVFADLTEGA